MIDAAKVATELDVSTETIRRWIKEGRLRGTKLGGRWKVYPESIQENSLSPWLYANEIQQALSHDPN